MGSIGRIFLLDIESLGDRERVGSEKLRTAFLDRLFWLESSQVLFSLSLLVSGSALVLFFFMSISETRSSKSKKESSSSSSSNSSPFLTRGFGAPLVVKGLMVVGLQNLRKFRTSMVVRQREREREREIREMGLVCLGF